MPNGHIIYLKPEAPASRKTEALFQYQDAVIRALHAKQRLLLAQFGATWLVVSISLLALGHLIAWVVRGFRQGNPGPPGKRAP